MGGQLRVYRRRIASVSATKKITRAQELIATARIVKAQLVSGGSWYSCTNTSGSLSAPTHPAGILPSICMRPPPASF